MKNYLITPKTTQKDKFFLNCANITYSYFGHNYTYQTNVICQKKEFLICTKKIKKKIFLTKREDEIRKIISTNIIVEDVKVYNSAKNKNIISVNSKVIIEYINIFLKNIKTIKNIPFYIFLSKKKLDNNIEIRLKNNKFFKINSVYLLANIVIEVFQV